MSRDAKIKIGATTKVKGPISGVIAQLKKLGSVTKKVSAGMRKLGAGIGKSMRAAAVSIGIAVAAGTVLVKLYTKQQDAEGRLVDALKLTGEATDANIDKFKKFASSIQKVTVHGDEAVLELFVLAKAMGITTDKAEDATKAAIGLAARYKIDVTSAMKLVAKASSGQTGELARYGIVLKSTLSPQEKFNALLMMGKASFSFAEKEAGRLAGRFAQFKNSLGDVGEKFGLLIVKSLNLEERFLQLRDGLDAFIDRMDRDNSIQKWAEQAETKIAAVISLMKDAAKRRELFGAVGNVIFAAFTDGAATAINILLASAPAVGHVIGEAIKTAMLGGRSMQAALIQAEKEGFTGKSAENVAARVERAKQIVKESPSHRLDKEGKAAVSKFGLTTERTKTALADLNKLTNDEGGTIVLKSDTSPDRKAEDDRTRFIRLAAERKAAKAKVQMEKFGMARFAKETTNFLFGKKKDSRKFQPEMLGDGVERRKASPWDGIAPQLVRSKGREFLSGKQQIELGKTTRLEDKGPASKFGNFTRLEGAGPEIEKGIEERRGIGLGELFDMKQFGMTKTTGELGEANNPMHVVLDEAPV